MPLMNTDQIERLIESLESLERIAGALERNSEGDGRNGAAHESKKLKRLETRRSPAA